MKTLLTGHIGSLSKSFYQQLKKYTRLVTMTSAEETVFSQEKVRRIITKVDPDSYDAILSAHSFDTVVYFLHRPEEESGEQKEVERLVQLLDACVVRPVKKIIIVSSAYRGKAPESSTDDIQIPADAQEESRILSTCDDVCRLYKERYALPLTVLHIPFLFSSVPGDNYLTRKLEELIQEGATELDGSPQQTMDFLAQKDLAVLIGRVALEPRKNITILKVPGLTRLTVGELAEVLHQRFPDTEIRFSGKKLLTDPPVNSQTAFQEFQWQAETDVRDVLNSLAEEIKHLSLQREKRWKRSWKEIRQKYPYLLIGLELILGYFLMQWLNEQAGGLVAFRLVDFRLLFVVLFAAVHGHKIGILAAVLAQWSLFADYRTLEVDWQFLFYNVYNWVPFTVYLIVGATLGFIRDQNRLKQAALSEENQNLTHQHGFLREIYEDLLHNKITMEKQIISSDENFGRLFQTLNKLDQIDSSTFFSEALQIMEELLDNRSLGFYEVAEGAPYAYQLAASPGIQNKFTTKIELQDNPEIKRALRETTFWANKSIIKDYPAFIYAVSYQGKTKILLIVHEVPFEKMNKEQENLLKVAGSLISASLQHVWAAEEESAAVPVTSRIVEMEKPVQPAAEKKRQHWK